MWSIGNPQSHLICRKTYQACGITRVEQIYMSSRRCESFLSHLQVTIDVSYISPDVSDVAFRGRPIPIRTTSINRDSPGLQVPSQLLPPQTPSPMPRSDESDEIYVNSEGTLLRSFIWGDESSNSEDTFRLLWLEKQKDWLAVYKLNTSVCE